MWQQLKIVCFDYVEGTILVFKACWLIKQESVNGIKL